MVCTNCGLIANQIFEKPSLQLINTEGSYRNQYNSISERPSSMKTLGTFLGTYQKRNPSSMKTLGTFLGTYQKRNLKDVTGSALSSERKLQFRRLKSVNDIYLHFNGRQREYRGYSLLTRVCSTLEITDTTKADALYLFKKVHLPLRNEMKLSCLVMGAIYLAIRTRKENIELNRLIKAVHDNRYSIRGKEIIRAASLIRKHAKIRVQHVKSEEYLENIIGRIQKDYYVRNEVMKKIKIKNEYYHCLKVVAKQLLKQFPTTKRGGRNPFILAAAMINAADIILARHKVFPQCYLNQRRRGVLTQKKISEILDIAEFTLREHYLLLAKPLVEAY
ncbi:MAG: hypothetical protein ACTSQ9_07805 [Candidatus Hodarchaeales archaeon]